jgi:hypothetical protein
VRDRGGAIKRLCEGENRFEVMGGEELTGGGGSMTALCGQWGMAALANGGVEAVGELVGE